MKHLQLIKSAARSGLLLSGICLAASSLSAATPLLSFGFDEGSGTNTVDSVNKLPGLLGVYADAANNPVVSSASPSGASGDKAVSLNVGNPGSTGFLVVDDNDSPILNLSTNAFTIETWVKIDAGDTRTIEGIAAYGSSYKLGLNNGQIQFTLFGVVDINSGLYLTADDVWHHVAVTWQPGVGATFFLDGGNEIAIAETGSIRAFANNYLTIGSEGISNGNALQGTVDRFRIHKAVLTADQLDSVAATPKGVLSSTLVAFNFNESAAPFASAASVARAAKPSNPYVVALVTPDYSTDTPSGKSGDYSMSFIAGDKLVVQDPNGILALDQDNPSFTIQAWIKPGVQPTANTKSIIFFNNGPGGALSFAITKATRHVMITTLGVADIESKATVPDDGAWHHIAVVHENGKEMRFYVDGGLGDTIAYTGGVIFTRTDAFFQFATEGGNQYVGLIDRFKLSKGTMTVDELDWWPIPGVQPGSPTLSIANSVVVSWPTSPAGYTLQSSADLGDVKNWTTVTNTPYVGSSGYFLTFPSTASKVFYRLYKP